MNENLIQNTQQQQPNFQYNYNDPSSYQNMMRQAAMRQPQFNPYLQAQVPAMPQNYLKGRPVASFEEARASQIDLDGSLYIFTDLANKKIYTKQINPDGTVTLNTYVYTEPPKQNAVEYITKDEFYSSLTSFKDALAEIRNSLTAAAATNQQEEKKSIAQFKF